MFLVIMRTYLKVFLSVYTPTSPVLLYQEKSTICTPDIYRLEFSQQEISQDENDDTAQIVNDNINFLIVYRTTTDS